MRNSIFMVRVHIIPMGVILPTSNSIAFRSTFEIERAIWCYWKHRVPVLNRRDQTNIIQLTALISAYFDGMSVGKTCHVILISCAFLHMVVCVHPSSNVIVKSMHDLKIVYEISINKFLASSHKGPRRMAINRNNIQLHHHHRHQQQYSHPLLDIARTSNDNRMRRAAFSLQSVSQWPPLPIKCGCAYTRCEVSFFAYDGNSVRHEAPA